MKKTTIGFAMCGSFCTFEKAFRSLTELLGHYDVVPIMSQNAYETDTRFGRAEEHILRLEAMTDKRVIHTIVGAEPLGPKKMVDLLVVAPCTGNTLSKIANAITDTPVTMAVKSVLRIGTPVVLCLATNDALAASAQNIGKLLNTKNIYVVPFAQDDPPAKPTSLVSDFDLLLPAVQAAMNGTQLQPLLQPHLQVFPS